ncbi:uncharacterized protein LOC143151639 [Ptiloglossa arizonensis]|uniref:uncharacterized protein LOC143151639 n=1 Tax=Ptiloglossa arizonensis TaxID=3350558 RepID=UPI003FA10271
MHFTNHQLMWFQVLLILSLLAVICSTVSALKNDRGGPSFGSGPNFIHSRRIALNEYLIPPPPPRHHPVRSGRVASPQSAETPGYFSKFMDWLNPFGYGSSSSPPLTSPPYLQTPSLPTPQSHPLPFNLHPAASQPGPSLQPPPGLSGAPLYPLPGPQPNLPLYPPLSSSPNQHSGLVLSPPPSQHSGSIITPPLSPPPSQHSSSVFTPSLSPRPSQHSGSLLTPPLPPPPKQPLTHHSVSVFTPPLPPPLNQPPNQHSGSVLTPPLVHPPGQHSDSLFTPPVGVHPDLPINPPPNPSLPIYNAPPPPLHDARHYLPPLKNDQDAYLSVNKGKPCNPCNKFPWIPMQDGGVHSDTYPLPSQLSNGYLPPANQVYHDTQHSASHEIRIPDFSHVQVHQNGQQGIVGPLPNPLLYPGPMPPLYKAKPFDRPSQSSHTENVGHLEPPPLPIAFSTGQEHKNSEIGNENFNHDLTSSGTQINQGHVSVIPQNHEIETGKELTNQKDSFVTSILDNQSPISGPSVDQEHHNPSVLNQGHGGILNHPVQDNQDTVASFGATDFENHDFTSQNGNAYRESFESNSGLNNGLHYLPANLNPSASYGTSDLNNQGVENLNYQYSDDLSPSSSIVKDSHATTQTSFASRPVTNENLIHFEESSLLDLTKKGESRTDTQWPSPTHTYINTGAGIGDNVKTTANYNLQTDNTLTDDSLSFTKPSDGDFGTSTPVVVDYSESNEHRYIETSTINTRYNNQQDVSYIPPSGQPGFLWPSLLLNAPNSKNESFENTAFLDPLARWHNSSKEVKHPEQQGRPDSKDANDSVQRQQNVKRNKQVQVIIPYTSEYTPIPFQQSYGDWSVRNNPEKTQPRKVPPVHDTSIDNYVQQESKNEIQLINHLQSEYNFNNSNKLNTRVSLTSEIDARPTTTKANNSIDVRRLQKNIDNWTIQEYSKFTTSSTALPSSSHPYLLPSKKIPTEYLTTTEPGDHANVSNEKNESVKSYSLAGFSFNEIEHEGSASNHIEQTQTPLKVLRIESSKSTTSISESTDKSMINEKSTWDEYSVSISPVNKERVYVVTPQPIPLISSKIQLKQQIGVKEQDNLQETSKPSTNDAQESNDSLSEFEAIEKAYQVLPQAVNNLAVASTGKEDIPLWGIMEHEEFASLNLDETADESTSDVLDGPVLYSGHSKVSRAKR